MHKILSESLLTCVLLIGIRGKLSMPGLSIHGPLCVWFIDVPPGDYLGHEFPLCYF